VELFLQITLGVFLGSLSSQLVLDVWHGRHEASAKSTLKKVRREQERVREVQDQHIRALLKQTRNIHQPTDPPLGFVADDVQQ
jgi:hypothetical protein